MNAAFLLVTSAMLVGQGGDKKVETIPPPAGKPAPGAPAVVASNCGQDCGGCEKFGHRLRDRLGGLFRRDCRDNCQAQTCCDKQRFSLFRNDCDNGCRPKIWNWNRDHGHHNNCTANCNDSCGRGGLGILDRLKGRFHRNDACCDGGCNTVVAPPKAGEQIPPPAKKMPVDNTPKKTPQVNIGNPPAPLAPTAIPSIPAAPSVEVTPIPAPPPVAVPVPRVEGASRDPF